ncbi:hypothetical protein [Clostridium tarantellae]|uniref:Ferredoxin n=1 Tax=Clostridium tarantellae TaxID=39493 RepID=A0A6I1MP82_9CLOT|nr:hypothetical protein [Clostridium tarantellae]MPQ44032.1 hypothetical protein [Clostridium tarantellae]
MRIVKAELKAVRKLGIDIKLSNGMRQFIMSIDKKNLSMDDLLNYDENMEIKVHSMVRNCCAACPIVVLEKGKNEADDNELKEIIRKIIELDGENIKKALNK